jgi:hypothetical protein
MIAELHAYEHKVDHEADRFSISGFPQQIKRQVEIFALSTKPRRRLEAAAAFAIREGCKMLEVLPSIAVIRQCREVVLASGSDRIVWFEHFPFEIPSQDSERIRFWCRVPREDATRCGQLSMSLGLPAPKIAALGIMATLIHVPTISDTVKRGMFDVLRAFARKVKARAAEAEEIRDRVVSIPKPSMRLTFDDVLAAEDEE